MRDLAAALGLRLQNLGHRCLLMRARHGANGSLVSKSPGYRAGA
jgi:hypothetical protein